MTYDLPENLQRLHDAEQLLREKSLELIRDTSGCASYGHVKKLKSYLALASHHPVQHPR
jgi:hypothetical protein